MRLIPVLVAVLIVIGIGSSVARSIYPADLVTRIEPFRSKLLRATGSADPFPARRAETAARVDVRFAKHPFVTYTHMVLGGLFLVIAPLQFSQRLRNRHRWVHRWVGRGLVVIGVTASVSGLFFGVILPFAGTAERIVITIVSATVIGALLTAVSAIRRGNVDRHRAWVIRTFALMLGISTVRLVAAVLDLALSPLGYTAEAIFVASLWLGWGSTLAAAEVWLRSSGRAAPHNIHSR